MFTDEKGHKYSGAGVLVLEDYRFDDNREELCAVLVKNPKGKYMDFGRVYKDKDSSLDKTANKGLFKESLGLYNIAPRHLKPAATIKVPKTKTNCVETKYKSYIVKINDSSRSHFYHNRTMMKLSKQRNIRVPYLYHKDKKVDIVHVPIKNIDFVSKTVRDIDGNVIELSGRTLEVMKASKNEILAHRNARPVARASDLFINKGNNWVDNTMSFLAR